MRIPVHISITATLGWKMGRIDDERIAFMKPFRSCDKALNITAETLLEFSVEIPSLMPELKPHFLDIADSSISCLENTVSGIRSYFKNVDAVRDYVTKVQFYKKETNKIAERIKRTVFRTDKELSYKIHTRYFTFHIERIAEQSEDVCDRLSIAIIKRFE